MKSIQILKPYFFNTHVIQFKIETYHGKQITTIIHHSNIYIIGGINYAYTYIYYQIYCTFITTFITCTFLCICHMGTRNHKTICNKIKCKHRSNTQTEYCIQHHRQLTMKKTKGPDRTSTLTQPQWQMSRLTDCVMVTGISGWKLISVSTHLIVNSYLCQVSQKITYLHIYQLKFCKHFSSLPYAGTLSSISYIVFIKDWHYYDCYLLYRINTVITSCFISMSTINHVSPDNVTASWTIRKHTCFQNCICDISVIIWITSFILHTWHKRCRY